MTIHFGKSSKYWLLALSAFPTLLSNALLSGAATTQYCEVNPFPNDKI